MGTIVARAQGANNRAGAAPRRRPGAPASSPSPGPARSTTFGRGGAPEETVKWDLRFAAMNPDHDSVETWDEPMEGRASSVPCESPAAVTLEDVVALRAP